MKRTFNYCFIVSKDTGVITVEQKRINNALIENRNAIIKFVTKTANVYRNWNRFRNGCMIILEKASILKSTRMTEALKWLKKKDPNNKMLSEPNISYKTFWGICRPLKSWRANSPNPHPNLLRQKTSRCAITTGIFIILNISIHSIRLILIDPYKDWHC